MADSYEFELEALRGELIDLRRVIGGLSNPQVSGKASAFVALAKDSRLDGRIGAGDVTVSVLLATGGACIGAIGASSIWVGGGHIVPMSTGEFFTLSTMAGCALGLGRMAIDALAVPMMLSNVLEWLEDRWGEWLDHKAEIQPEPESTREIPVFNRGEPAGFVSIPEVTEFKTKTLKIPSVNLVDGLREIEVDKLCLFLKNAVATGQWARDRQTILSQKEHPDVAAYLRGKGWWEIKDTPTLRRACSELRGGVTNGTERNGTNEGTR
jgi:hypothetical protein